jgi:uncharacterized protein (DUF1778 family)
MWCWGFGGRGWCGGGATEFCIVICITECYERYMTHAQTKDHPLSLRLPQADLALIDRAAKLKGSSRTEFMRDAAVREAETLILDRTMITMSAEGFKAFLDEIDSPAKPIPEMVELLKRKAPWEKT